ncbi:hypothetical protein AGDE_07789 [Angomonas deanei]|nr:hypothetical protein AGDE_07789 [Angomonas deanei]|eukprot:EPY34847.1 hypothetical protein AGDE_07789 [Angomonas deanei]
MGAGDGKEVPYFLRPQPKITTEVAHLLSKFSFNETAQVLFYRVHRGLPTTSLAFPSEGNTHAVLCGSRRHTEVKGLNLEQSPSDEVHCAPISFIPSFAGGVETLCLTKNDREVLVAVAGQPLVVVCTHWKGSPSFTTVDVPAPVVQFLPAGNATLHESDLYFLRFDQLETIALVQCNPLLGLQVLSFVSTGLYRGVGGIPRRVDCSACRLYILLETGHLLVCHYTTVEGHLHCAPVGVAAVGYVSAMSAIQFDTHCSLLALADKECDVSMIPSFHF